MRNKGLVLVLSFLLFYSTGVYSQTKMEKDSTLEMYEARLVSLADSMYYAFIPDMRIGYNESFIRTLVAALKKDKSFAYPFTKLGDKISIIMPEDKSFKLFNWSSFSSENTLRSYGAIQMNSDSLKLYPLIDMTNELKPEDRYRVLDANKWLGCFYYNMVEHKDKSGNYYTLFGINRADPLITVKMLDVLSFTDKVPVFGKEIFMTRNEAGMLQPQNRFIMEYKKGAQVSLNYDQEKKAIVFDKLVSQVNDPNRKYTFVASGQYDGFEWKKGMWRYKEDLLPLDIRKDGEAPAPNPIKN